MSGQLDPSPAESVVADLNVQATGVGVKPNRPVRSVRRTVYLPVIRNDLPPLFQLFDFGDSLSVNGRRSATNVAPQALFMMNSPLVLEAATAHGRERPGAAGDAPDEREVLDRLYLRILGRPPRADEVEPSLDLVHAALSESSGPSRRLRIGGRRVGAGPGVGGPRATPCSVRRASSISIEEGRDVRTATDRDFATGAPQGRRLRVRIPRLRGARLAGRRGRAEPARREAAALRPRGPSG